MFGCAERAGAELGGAWPVAVDPGPLAVDEAVVVLLRADDDDSWWDPPEPQPAASATNPTTARATASILRGPEAGIGADRSHDAIFRGLVRPRS